MRPHATAIAAVMGLMLAASGTPHGRHVTLTVSFKSLAAASADVTCKGGFSTYSCEYKHHEFAPHGELSIFHARLKAIKLAKNYIFIQDQYFLHVPQLMDALLGVLPTLQRLIIVSQPASNSSARYGFDKYQWEMITRCAKSIRTKSKSFGPKPSARFTSTQNS